MVRYFTLFFLLFTLVSCTQESSLPTPVAEKQSGTILALGDSLTAGYGLAIEESYPAQLEGKLKALGYKYTVQNAGVSGDTTAGLLSHMDWVLEGNSPDLVILCIGANDTFQGKPIGDIESNIRTIVRKLKEKSIPILFAGMKAPLNLGGDYGREYEAMYQRIANQNNLVFMPFFLSGVAMKAELNQEDRIHPTKEGYAIIVDELIKILVEKQLIRK